MCKNENKNIPFLANYKFRDFCFTDAVANTVHKSMEISQTSYAPSRRHTPKCIEEG